MSEDVAVSEGGRTLLLINSNSDIERLRFIPTIA